VKLLAALEEARTRKEGKEERSQKGEGGNEPKGRNENRWRKMAERIEEGRFCPSTHKNAERAGNKTRARTEASIPFKVKKKRETLTPQQMEVMRVRTTIADNESIINNKNNNQKKVCVDVGE
jgi:hypothetical protein